MFLRLTTVLVAWPMRADRFIIHSTAVRVAESEDAVPDPGALVRVLVEAVKEGDSSWCRRSGKDCD